MEEKEIEAVGMKDVVQALSLLFAVVILCELISREIKEHKA